MNITDVKILWGRAANRCSFPDCKIELTPAGGKNTLGEIAHIVAKSPEGPRGESDLPTESRDSYENRILLCPTHHKTIDNDPETYTVEKLHQMKQKHEEWVSERLDKGVITVRSIDNSLFLDLRKKDWVAFVKDYIWVISSITPLDISNDAIDPLSPVLLESFNSQKIPYYGHDKVSNSDTRPNQLGVINENLRNISRGYGHRIQIFRNGHCEFLVCFESQTRMKTVGTTKILPYSLIRQYFTTQIQGLVNFWHAGLTFNDMLLTCMVINTAHTQLGVGVTGRSSCEPLGNEVNSNELEYNTVVNRQLDITSTVEHLMKYFVNCYGLTLDALFDKNGKEIEPHPLS